MADRILGYHNVVNDRRDTWERIAKEYGTTVEELKENNKDIEVDSYGKVKKGQKIKVPVFGELSADGKTAIVKREVLSEDCIDRINRRLVSDPSDETSVVAARKDIMALNPDIKDVDKIGLGQELNVRMEVADTFEHVTPTPTGVEPTPSGVEPTPSEVEPSPSENGTDPSTPEKDEKKGVNWGAILGIAGAVAAAAGIAYGIYKGRQTGKLADELLKTREQTANITNDLRNRIATQGEQIAEQGKLLAETREQTANITNELRNKVNGLGQELAETRTQTANISNELRNRVNQLDSRVANLEKQGIQIVPVDPNTPIDPNKLPVHVPSGNTPIPTVPGGNTPAPSIPGGNTPAPSIPGGNTPAPSIPSGNTPAPSVPGSNTPISNTTNNPFSSKARTSEEEQKLQEALKEWKEKGKPQGNGSFTEANKLEDTSTFARQYKKPTTEEIATQEKFKQTAEARRARGQELMKDPKMSKLHDMHMNNTAENPLANVARRQKGTLKFQDLLDKLESGETLTQEDFRGLQKFNNKRLEGILKRCGGDASNPNYVAAKKKFDNSFNALKTKALAQQGNRIPSVRDIALGVGSAA